MSDYLEGLKVFNAARQKDEFTPEERATIRDHLIKADDAWPYVQSFANFAKTFKTIAIVAGSGLAIGGLIQLYINWGG